MRKDGITKATEPDIVTVTSSRAKYFLADDGLLPLAGYLMEWFSSLARKPLV